MVATSSPAPSAAPLLARCTLDHESLKSDPRWDVLVLIGVQHTPADETGPAEDLELRNCYCGSTLAKLVAL